jgi:hypothetical protein
VSADLDRYIEGENLRAKSRLEASGYIVLKPTAAQNVNLLGKLADLHKQATTERSHYYVAATVREAIAEIARLREIEWKYEELCK